MNDIIITPAFNRLADWVGLWAMEPLSFRCLAEQLSRIDLAAHVINEKPPEMKSALEKVPARNGQSVAIVKVMGTLMKSQSSVGGGTSTVQLRRDIRQAATDQEVSAILLAIDSPGGTSAGTDDLASEVRMAAKQKPVWAHIDDLGASAAYWVASQASQIFANSPTAQVGSIGTFMVVYDMSEAAANEGIKVHRFATGPLKGAGARGTVLTEEQRAHLQQLTDETQSSFDAGVKRGRSLTDRQLADVRTGGVWTAQNAINMKLIDGIRPLGKTLDELVKFSSNKGAQQNASALPMTVRHTLPMLSASHKE